MTDTNILAFSVIPIFKEHIHGGAQRIFMDIIQHMADTGHNIKVLCTTRDDNKDIFKIGNNIEVMPVLKYRETVPMPYQTAPYNLLDIINTVRNESQNSDILYLHADGFYFKKFLNEEIPVIASLHDFIYEISTVSAILGGVDQLIVPSEYIEKCLCSTVGNLYCDYMEIVKVVPNGIDQNVFKKNEKSRAKIRKEYEIDEDDKIILFPHRPDESKGINDALKLMNFLVHEKNENVKLFLPKYIDLTINNELEPYYIHINNFSKKHDLSDNIVIYEWVPTDKVPELYNMADLTLNIGNFVESFGLTGLESLCCETPIIVSKSGAMRYTYGNMDLPMIDFNDFDNLKQISSEILNNEMEFDFKMIKDAIANRFSYEKMLNEYKYSFENIEKKSKRHLRNNNNTNFYKLAPWCYTSTQGIYNDYLKRFIELPRSTIDALSKNNIKKDDPEIVKYLKTLKDNHLIVDAYIS